MRTLPSALSTHLAEEVTTLAVCWLVTRRDGVFIRGTQHDEDIVVPADSPPDSPASDLPGTYVAAAAITGSSVRSTSDMSVDNLEVNGAVPQDPLLLMDLTAADIEAGLFDGASVKLFLVNWAVPGDGQIILRTGTLGNITRTAEGEYRTELRGLAQHLTQNIIRTYGTNCDAELGDARCGVNVASLALTGTVTAVTSNRRFTATLSSTPTELGYLDGGMLTWTTGNNDDFTMEVKRGAVGDVHGEITLFLPMHLDIEVGDTFSVQPGCDKAAATCKGKFNNIVNFRGHGFWVPGLGEMAAFGGQTAERRARAADLLDYPRPRPGVDFVEP